MTGGLLAVHAHPDDETLSTGALLASWAGAGRDVTVVTCTRGEQGEVIPEQLRHLEGSGRAFASHREVELAVALDALRVRDHLFLDRAPGPAVRIVDSGMAWVGSAGSGRAGAADDVPDGALVSFPLEDAARRLAAVLVDRRPAVVATYEPGGGYGHPDHVRAHELTMRAVELAVDQGLPRPAVLWAVLERDPWRAAIAEMGGPGLPAELTPVDPASEPSAVTGRGASVRVDVRPVRDALLAALRAHETQVQGVEAVEGTHAVGRFALSNGIVQPVLAAEAYVAADAAAEERVHEIDWPAGCGVVGTRAAGATRTDG